MDLKDKVQELAKFNNRSTNQEMVTAIEYCVALSTEWAFIGYHPFDVFEFN
ncbi:hypothetical protein AB7W84_00735 [Providencia rettgeri]